MYDCILTHNQGVGQSLSRISCTGDHTAIQCRINLIEDQCGLSFTSSSIIVPMHFTIVALYVRYINQISTINAPNRCVTGLADLRLELLAKKDVNS